MSSPVLQDVIQSALFSLGTQLISDQLQNETQRKVHHNFSGDTKLSCFFFYSFIYSHNIYIFSGKTIKPKKVHADKLTRNPIATISAFILIIFKQEKEKEKKFTGIALFDEIPSTSDG